MNSPCRNGGTCNAIGTAYLCTCPTDYTGENCETPRACQNNPCANNGLCVPIPGGFSCECTPAYTGTVFDTFNQLVVYSCQNCNIIQSISVGFGLHVFQMSAVMQSQSDPLNSYSLNSSLLLNSSLPLTPHVKLPSQLVTTLSSSQNLRVFSDKLSVSDCTFPVFSLRCNV